MKCPSCGYIDEWDPETLTEIYGEKGPFYSGIVLCRNDRYSDADQVKHVFGCPSCTICFIAEL